MIQIQFNERKLFTQNVSDPVKFVSCDIVR